MGALEAETKRFQKDDVRLIASWRMSEREAER